MNVIVSGGDGFVGSNVVNKLVKNGHNVLVFDILDKPNRIDISNPKIKYISSSISCLNKHIDELKSFKPNVAYHFAWKGSAGPLREDYLCQINNALETVKFLKLVAKLGCKKFIVAGSITEFETIDIMYKDGTTTPKSCYYGVGKQLAHELCKPLANSLNIDFIWAYITNTYGVGEKSPRLINNVIRKIILKEDFDFTSAIQNYDFVYIDDVANAFYLLCEYGIKNNTYLIGSGNAKPLKEFILEIYKTLGASSHPNFGNAPFIGVNLPLECFSIKNLIRDTGYKPKYSFSKGIELTFNWIKSFDSN